MNVSISFIGGGNPETFAKAADSVIKGFFGGNGGGINSNRLNELVDILLEICEW